MKKMLLLSNLAWVCFIVLMKCNDADSCSKTYPTAFGGVEAEKFVKALARYRAFHYNAVNTRVTAELQSNNPFRDARSCWYSTDTLKKFIELIEKYAVSDKIRKKPKELGIRFYYAAYDSTINETYTLLDPTHSGNNTGKEPLGMYHTLFMVPTFYDEELKFDVDFDPRYSSGLTIEQLNRGDVHSGDFVPLHAKDLFIWNIYEKDPHAKLFILDHTAFDYKAPSVQNQGRLCPPNCPESTLSTLTNADTKFPDGVITR